jgi:hypothetical protein
VNPLRQRLAELQARPGDDGPELAFVAGLLDRADALGHPGLGLARRAEARLAQLEVARAQAEERVGQAVRTLAARGLEQPPAAVGQALDRGAPARALRLLERQLGDALPVRARATQERLRRLYEALQGRGLRLPGPLEARLDGLLGPLDLATASALAESGRALAGLLVTLLYEHASRDSRAVTAVRRAARRRPQVAGPYNPSLLVAQLFAELESLAPAYLQDLLEALARHAALLRLPEAGEPMTGRSRRRRQPQVLDPTQLAAQRWVARS